jgi:hypothetical protein
MAIIPNFHPRLFWEFIFEEIQWKDSYKMVISRIIERGNQEDINELIRFYSKEKIIQSLMFEIKFLPNFAIESAIEFFPELKKEDLLCYQNRKTESYHWI